MDRPCTAQQLIDWIDDFQAHADDSQFDEATTILKACKAYLEALRETA